MPSFVLDTHACIFSIAATAKLGAKARQAMKAVEAGRAEAWIPAAAIAEIVMLRELGRIEIGLPHIRTAMEQAPMLRFLPLDFRQLDEFAVLGTLDDPFDRLIVAASRSLGARLVTKDRSIEERGFVQTIWS